MVVKIGSEGELMGPVCGGVSNGVDLGDNCVLQLYVRVWELRLCSTGTVVANG